MNDEKIFVDNDKSEDLLLDLPSDEIDKLYYETFETNNN